MSDQPSEHQLDPVDAARLARHAERLARIEVDNVRLRRLCRLSLGGLVVILGVVVAVTLAFASGMLPPPGSVVRAETFVLVDRDGRLRGSWGMNEEGAVQFLIHDDQARVRLRASVLSDGASGLALVDVEGNARAALGRLADGTVTLVFADPEGRGRTVLGLTPDGTSSLALADRTGRMRAGLGVEASGQAVLTIEE